jgi:hypothetical protein
LSRSGFFLQRTRNPKFAEHVNVALKPLYGLF